MSQHDNSPQLGTVWFAVVVLVLAGLLNLVIALVALVRSAYFSGTPAFGSFGAWAIWGFVLAALLFLAAALITEGARSGRWLGIVLAVLNAVGQMLFWSANPGWALLVVLLDVIVIWVLAVHGETFTH